MAKLKTLITFLVLGTSSIAMAQPRYDDRYDELTTTLDSLKENIMIMAFDVEEMRQQ